MQINYSNQNYQPNFEARVSKDFVNAARNYFKSNPVKMDAFEKQVEKFKDFGTDDINIVFDKVFSGGKKQHVLYAIKDGMKPGEYIVLTAKDQFRKVVEKFMHINKYEFDIKTKDIR